MVGASFLQLPSEYPISWIVYATFFFFCIQELIQNVFKKIFSEVSPCRPLGLLKYILLFGKICLHELHKLHELLKESFKEFLKVLLEKSSRNFQRNSLRKNAEETLVGMLEEFIEVEREKNSQELLEERGFRMIPKNSLRNSRKTCT